MTTKKSKAYERLVKKFQALRVTLPDDEREIFDSIVTDEVKAHQMNQGSVRSAVSKSGRGSTRKSKEAKAHQMTDKGVRAAVSKGTRKGVRKSEEAGVR